MTVALLSGLYTAVVITSPSPTGYVDVRNFDRSLDWEETLTGITSLRRELAARATGHVLETAVGTGRNFEFYRWDGLWEYSQDARPLHQRAGNLKRPAQLQSFTGVDISPEMLEIATEKLTRKVESRACETHGILVPREYSRRTAGGFPFIEGNLRLFQMDSQEALPQPPESDAHSTPSKYDTVIQSFGLCSIANPGHALAAMARAVKPESGRIFLLEHGRGWSVINGRLDRNAESHFRRYGCWFNRDIEAIVRDAAKTIPGLTVVAVERRLFLQLGTLLWIELKVQHPATQA